MTTRNNDLLYNAALAGCLAGQVGQSAGSGQGATVAADYASQLALAQAFAAAVDTAITNDTTLSTSGGVPIVATSGAQIGNQFAKTQLIESLSELAWKDRNYNGTPSFSSGSGASLVAAVVAAYTEGVTGVQVT